MPDQDNATITYFEVDDPNVVPQEVVNRTRFVQALTESAVFIVVITQELSDADTVSTSQVAGDAELWVENLRTTVSLADPSVPTDEDGLVLYYLEHSLEELDVLLGHENVRAFQLLSDLYKWAVEFLMGVVAIDVHDEEQWKRVCLTYGVIIP